MVVEKYIPLQRQLAVLNGEVFHPINKTIQVNEKWGPQGDKFWTPRLRCGSGSCQRFHSLSGIWVALKIVYPLGDLPLLPPKSQNHTTPWAIEILKVWGMTTTTTGPWLRRLHLNLASASWDRENSLTQPRFRQLGKWMRLQDQLAAELRLELRSPDPKSCSCDAVTSAVSLFKLKEHFEEKKNSTGPGNMVNLVKLN